MSKTLLRLLDWIFVLRPTLLIPVCTVFLCGYSKGEPELSAIQWLVFTIGSISMGGAVYLFNTIYDQRSDEENDKNLFLVKGIFTEKTLFIYALILSMVGLALLLWIFQKHFLTVLLGFLFTGIFYNIPPFKLKDRVGTDAAVAMLGGGLTYWCALRLSNAYPIETIIPYLFAFTGVSLWTQIPDIQGDKLAKKKTFAVHYGAKKTAIVGWIFILCSVLSSIITKEKIMLQASILTLIVSSKLIWNTDEFWAGLSSRFAIFILTLFIALEFPIYLFSLIIYYWVARIYYQIRFEIRYPTLFGTKWI
ncbi:MAG: UbiA family prenyltransferase [bacterium]|nr:UbiA family prenyltransferase [bacterium]